MSFQEVGAWVIGLDLDQTSIPELIMKILIVTTSFPRWFADHRAPFIWEAAKSVKMLGNQVKVIAMYVPGSKTKEVWDGVEIIRPRYLPDRFNILQKDRAGIPSFWRTRPWLRILLLPFFIVHTLAVLVNACDCDLVHANWTLSGFAVWLGKFIHRKNFIVTVHGSDIFQAGKSGLIRWITQKMLNKARYVIAVSTALAKELVQWKIPLSQIVVIPDGVNAAFFSPSNSPRHREFLFVGSLTESKGIDFLLEAFARLLNEYPDFRLKIIGDGNQLDHLRDRSKKLCIDQKVDFLGSLSQDEVRVWMQRAYLLVLPSLSEGLGVVLLEAMACGTPCIGCRVGGIPDIITPEVGILVPPADANELYLAMLRMIVNEALWAEMSRNARQRIQERFTWQKIGEEINKIYHSVV